MIPLAHATDPVTFAREALGFNPDPWQVAVLRSSSKRLLLNCARQSGKSTIAAILGLHRALCYSRSLVLLISPSLRQSSELFRKVDEMLDRLQEPPRKTEDNRLSLALENRSRIVSLPSTEETIRGFSGASLIVEDEAARVDDTLYAAVRPMLAVSNGQLILMSTPAGKQGHFYEAWENGGDTWERTRITADQCPRISPEFLKQERAALGEHWYSQEYLCEFGSIGQGNLFHAEWFRIIEKAPARLAMVRYWDLAATEGGGDWTVGALVGYADGAYYILDIRRLQGRPRSVEDLILQTRNLDGPVAICMEEEPGSAGKSLIDYYARKVLVGANFRGIKTTGSKLSRAMPVSAAAEAGNVYLRRAPWNAALIEEFTAFPDEKIHDDQVDAVSGAIGVLIEHARGEGPPIEDALSEMMDIPGTTRRSGVRKFGRDDDMGAEVPHL